MKTKKRSVTKPVLVKIAKALVKTQKEIDDLAVQFSLGKAEASDKFEEIKDNAKQRFQDLKNSLILTVGEDRVHVLRKRLDDLDEQFAHGKAETLEFFEEQREKITKALHDMESEVESNAFYIKMRTAFATEIEHLKLKLAVLKKQFESKSVDAGLLFKEKMGDARHEIDALMAKAEDKWDDVKEKYEDFSHEIKESSKHLKKAIDVL
jgi:hypothetical protein